MTAITVRLSLRPERSDGTRGVEVTIEAEGQMMRPVAGVSLREWKDIRTVFVIQADRSLPWHVVDMTALKDAIARHYRYATMLEDAGGPPQEWVLKYQQAAPNAAWVMVGPPPQHWVES